MTGEEIALEYFARMRAGDLAVVDLFTDDAELRGMGQRVVGRDGVRAFYEQAQRVQRAHPIPGLVVAVGDQVLAEIHVDFADGRHQHIVDLFDLRDGRIAAVTYFVADYPAP